MKPLTRYFIALLNMVIFLMILVGIPYLMEDYLNMIWTWLPAVYMFEEIKLKS